MRGFGAANRPFTAIVMAISAIAGATSCATSQASAANEYCAIMSDSVGLYVGNPVTQMGYPIGEVVRIEPSSAEVKVVFTLNEGRPIPEGVRAVTRSPSILADRAIELVGNYDGGPKLKPAECIPLNRSSTPLSIAKIIGSATDFVNAINPDGSTNVADALRGIDEAMSGQGANANAFLTRASQLADNPDQTISEMGQITRNIAELTSMLRDNREPLKQILIDLPQTGPYAVQAVHGVSDLLKPLPELLALLNDLEVELGSELQIALDSVSELVRIASPHYKGIANILNPLPRFISGVNGEPVGATEGGLAKHLNNHIFNLLPWRPPLFRIPTPNGLLACGFMNASAPGSCADVAGRPYAVDVALLQYVLTEAQRR
ncbi:mammalian cell entry protein [Mycolicibacterium fortuitum]|uniref:Mammalian cell entry protein n=1 Tax=Mycolicibacterium fortuitum TaxID=1766 RepID=A0ABD6QHW3_MYCFO|nr:MlaD family protein [Mycolicibacterium fortuitum]OMC39561.1 mammalian cell entry protein [Mycolicibacterium fortuitum]